MNGRTKCEIRGEVVMSSTDCEVCGKPSCIHTTEVEGRSPLKREHHYCREHAPPEIEAEMPTPAEEVKMVEEMIAELDEGDADPELKAQFRQQLKKLAEDIAAGRRRFGDAE